ncbi:serine/threonine-protein kinase [Micromonospora endolithica]|uniref:non-specific serine/threonine protein kinase n=1 Tax=Micromonospora endolithica TaxID=230091 RepID=A0A3A9YWB9_9ACTN|nr:protein kinase [Micromonospora endolithica]RKN40313.1 serine/threonine protein kinase [Micromonospora endolithica]
MTTPTRIGDHRVERLLGVGSFATVWLARDPVLDSRVAIKVLAENWHHDLRVRERFLDEARLLRRIDHERLVRVHRVGELADGRPYAVLDWADGGSLRDRLAAGPPPAPAAALDLLAEIAAGVAVLHRHRVVHRDLSPGNILFRSGPDGERVLIADLGLAKALAAASGLTARAGTPGYMAPEQDDPLAVVDLSADVYALGRLGRRLLGAPTVTAGVPPAVDAVLRRATARRAADRYPDATAFRAALGRAAAVPFPPDPALGGRWRRGIARGVLVLAAAGALAADAAAVVTSATSGPLRVALPAGWRAAGSGWAGRYDASGRLEPALVIAPDPRRWAVEETMPGAFVGLTTGAAGRTDPAAFVAARRHADCVAATPRRVSRAGLDWVVARFDCPRGRPVVVEAAASAPAGLLYVQVVPPVDAGPGFVDALLDGVRADRARRVSAPPRRPGT